jgi:hypothetical protein
VSDRGVIRAAWRSAGPSSSTWRLKKALASVMVVGSMTYLGVGGALALMSSETSNSGASIASGTLTFSNQVSTNTVCTSWGGGTSNNVNNACDALFSSGTRIYPGDSGTVKVTIKNDGSLPISSLSLFMPSCTATTSPGASSPGGGNPCASGGDQLYVQETDASWTPTTCRFPTGAGACSFAADAMDVFRTTYTSSGSALSLGSGPTAGSSRYFIIGLKLPSTAANSLQGEAATFDLTWQVST